MPNVIRIGDPTSHGGSVLENKSLMDAREVLQSQLLPFYVDREPGSPVV